jgi:hypothetical protein
VGCITCNTRLSGPCGLPTEPCPAGQRPGQLVCVTMEYIACHFVALATIVGVVYRWRLDLTSPRIPTGQADAPARQRRVSCESIDMDADPTFLKALEQERRNQPPRKLLPKSNCMCTPIACRRLGLTRKGLWKPSWFNHIGGICKGVHSYLRPFNTVDGGLLIEPSQSLSPPADISSPHTREAPSRRQSGASVSGNPFHLGLALSPDDAMFRGTCYCGILVMTTPHIIINTNGTSCPTGPAAAMPSVLRTVPPASMPPTPAGPIVPSVPQMPELILSPLPHGSSANPPRACAPIAPTFVLAPLPTVESRPFPRPMSRAASSEPRMPLAPEAYTQSEADMRAHVSLPAPAVTMVSSDMQRMQFRLQPMSLAEQEVISELWNDLVPEKAVAEMPSGFPSALPSGADIRAIGPQSTAVNPAQRSPANIVGWHAPARQPAPHARPPWGRMEDVTSGVSMREAASHRHSPARAFMHAHINEHSWFWRFLRCRRFLINLCLPADLYLADERLHRAPGRESAWPPPGTEVGVSSLARGSGAIDKAAAVGMRLWAHTVCIRGGYVLEMVKATFQFLQYYSFG